MADAKAVGDHETTEKEENAFQVDTLEVYLLQIRCSQYLNALQILQALKVFLYSRKSTREESPLSPEKLGLSRPAFQDN